MKQKYSGVDAEFVTKLAEEFSHLPHDELMRRAIIYATLYWALFCESVKDPVPDDGAQQDESSGEDLIDTDALRVYLEAKRRNVMSVVQAMACLEDFNLDIRLSKDSSETNERSKRNDETVAEPAPLPSGSSIVDTRCSPNGDNRYSSLSPSSYKSRQYNLRRSPGLEPETPRVQFTVRRKDFLFPDNASDEISVLKMPARMEREKHSQECSVPIKKEPKSQRSSSKHSDHQPVPALMYSSQKDVKGKKRSYSAVEPGVNDELPGIQQPSGSGDTKGKAAKKAKTTSGLLGTSGKRKGKGKEPSNEEKPLRRSRRRNPRH